jgi:flagellar hook-length control protein FliK
MDQAAKVQAPTPTKLAQPPTPGRLPEGVDELSIFRQISDAMKMRNGRTQRADIRLNPAELGAVRVQMEMRNGAVRVLVNTESSLVGDLVSNGLEQLRRDMLAQGVQVDHLEVRSELAGEGGQGDRPTGEGDDDASQAEKQENLGSGRRTHRGRISVQA